MQTGMIELKPAPGGQCNDDSIIKGLAFGLVCSVSQCEMQLVSESIKTKRAVEC